MRVLAGPHRYVLVLLYLVLEHEGRLPRYINVGKEEISQCLRYHGDNHCTWERGRMQLS